MADTRSDIRHDPLRALLDKYVEAEKADPSADGGSLSDLRQELETEYWKSVSSVVAEFVRDDLPKDFEVSSEDLELLSFGVLDHPRLSAYLNQVKNQATRPADAEYPVQFMHDALKAAYRDALRLETLAKLRQKLETVDDELKEWPEVNLEYVKYRDRLVADALGSTPQGQHLLRQYSELDERLEEFKSMERKNQSEGWQTGDERKQWLAIKQFMEQRHSEIARVLDPLSKKAKSIKEEIGRCETQAATASREVRDHERELQDLEATQKAGVEGTRADSRTQRQVDFAKEALARAKEQQAQAHSRAAQLKQEHADLLKADGIAAAGDAVVVTIDHLLDLRNEHRLVEAQIRDEETTVHQTTPADVRGALSNEVGNVRGLLRLSAKYAKAPESSLPLVPNANRVDPESLVAALRDIELIDPGLFANPGIKRFGKPGLFLAPGVGDGVYDSDRNRLVVPQHTLKSPLESVANAIVLFRLEADAGYSERALFRSFQREIKEYSTLRSNLKLRMSMIRDYLAWVTQEARGNQVLSREVREWFEEHIAPRKEDPIVPRELRGLASRQLKSKLDDTERAPASAERTYRAAMLRWLLEPDSEQNLKQQVLPLLEEAMMKAPENLDFVYSAGALHKRARHFARAIECFNRYATEARQSWWSRKAVELCAACR